MKYITLSVMLVLLTGCYKVGYEDFLDSRDADVGKKPAFLKPFKFKNAGKPRRGKNIITGQGFTHITKMKNGDLMYHWDSQEILPSFKGNKTWIGKCLTYEIIDAKTGLVKSWGFDKGGNPLSCRTWS
jgi:hypothetical protein